MVTGGFDETRAADNRDGYCFLQDRLQDSQACEETENATGIWLGDLWGKTMKLFARSLLFLLLSVPVLSQNPNTAAFPITVATDTNLAVAKRLSQSTLSSSINNSTTSIPVADGTQFLIGEVIRIDNEEIQVTNIVTNTLTGTRAFNGTTAASHTSGATVSGIITSWHHNQLAAEMKAIQARLRDTTSGCSDAGASDAYACDLTPPIASYSTGTVYRFKANTANTGAATINFNSLGAKTIRKHSSSGLVDLDNNDIYAGDWVYVVYNGTYMQLLGGIGGSGGGSWGSITGMLSSQTDLQTALDAKLAVATEQAGTPRYCRSTTGNDTYTCSVTPALTAYTRGGCLVLDADTANTGTATVNVNSLGAKSILNRAGSALSNSDILADKPVSVCYDGTQYIIQGDGSGSGASGNLHYCTATNVSNALTCNPSPSASTLTGMLVTVTMPIAFNNTGSVTLNVSGLGAKTVGVLTGGGNVSSLDAGMLQNLTYTFMYVDSADWFVFVAAPPYPRSTTSRNYLCTATSSSPTAYTCSNGWYSYGDGQFIQFAVGSTACTGSTATTLNIDSLGAKRIYRYDGTSDPLSTECPANANLLLIYDSALNSSAGGWRIVGGTPPGSGSGATMVSDLLDLKPSRTSASVMTVGGSCSSSTPCKVRVGEKVYSYTNSATVTLGASSVSTAGSTARFYVDTDGTRYCGFDANFTQANVTASNCTKTTATSFPVDSVPIFTMTAATTTADNWDAGSSLIDERAMLSSKRVSAGTGISESNSNGITTHSINTAVVPTFASSTTVPGSCTAYGQIYFDTDAGSGAKFYYCNGSTYETITGSAAAGGSNTQLQYNSSGSLAGMTEFTYGSSTIAGNSSAKLDMSAASVTAGLKIPSAAGAAPTADGFIAVDTTSHLMKFGSNSATRTPAVVEASNSWTAGVKQTFAPNATNAGINAGSVSGDPSSLSNGDLWYDSTGNNLRARINGSTVSLSAGGSSVKETWYPIASDASGNNYALNSYCGSSLSSMDGAAANSASFTGYAYVNTGNAKYVTCRIGTVPTGLTNLDISVLSAQGGTTGSQTYVVGLQAGCHAQGAGFTTLPTFSSVTNSNVTTNTTSLGTHLSTFTNVLSGLTCNAGDTIWIKYGRTGTNGSDNVTTEVYFLGITGKATY